MAVFSLGNTTANGNDAGEAVAVLWNPHATIALRVTSVEVGTQAAVTGGSTFRLARVSAKGTRLTVNTPDLDNHWGRRAAPVSGALIEQGNYTANPTEETPSLCRAHLGAGIGSMVGWWFPEPIIVPGGTGLGVFSSAAGSAFCHSWEWEE